MIEISAVCLPVLLKSCQSMWLSIGNCSVAKAEKKTPPPALTGHLTADSNVSTFSVGGGDGVFPLCLLSVSVPGACGTLYLTSRRNRAFKVFFYIFSGIRSGRKAHLHLGNKLSVSQFVSSKILKLKPSGLTSIF